ncbi:MAG: energy transducer TonB [Myxococcota bacterium]
MPTPTTYRIPDAKHEQKWSTLLGAAFAFVLFVLMALAQMLGDVEPPKQTLDETLVAFAPPEIEEVEEEPPPPPEEEEPPPELEAEPPQLSLDQLDIALNPGTGGSLAGDFAMPTIGSSASDLGTEDFVDFSDLDQTPRPMAGASLNFPRRLKKKAVSGKVVLFIQLDSDGRVLDAKVDSSTLPKFDAVVLSQVKKWKFTPPTKNGQPVKAQARLPIPINIRG